MEPSCATLAAHRPGQNPDASTIWGGGGFVLGTGGLFDAQWADAGGSGGAATMSSQQGSFGYYESKP